MVRAIEVNGGNKFTILWIYLTHWNCCCGITIPWTEEPGRLQSTGLQRVGHNWATEWIHFHFSLSSLSYAWPCATPWTAACKAFLSSTISWSLLNSCPLSQRYYLTISSSVTPSPPALSLYQHQGLFQGVGSSHQMTKVLELQHQSFQWIFRIDFL